VVVLLLLVVWAWLEVRPPRIEIPEQGVVLSDVTIVQPGEGRTSGQRISVEGGTITEIAPSEGVGRGDPYVGRYVLPGLIDMHVHHPPDSLLGDVELFGILFLAHGVTSVRDTGSVDGKILETRRRIHAGEQVGPRVFACGPILDGDPPFWPGSRVVRDAAEARSAVAELARDGVDCIKVYERLSRESLAAIREAARSAGLPVIGHVPRAVSLSDAELADVQHLTGLLEAGREELTEARLRSVIIASEVLNMAHTPTLVLWSHMARLADYEREQASPGARLLPRYYREILWNPEYDLRFRGMSAAQKAELGDAPAGAREVVKQLHAAGIRLHLGSDTMNPFVVPGLSLHEEMEEFVGLGLTAEEVWKLGTRGAGENLPLPRLGLIEESAPADLLIFREDPTRDLAALATLEAVVADGRLYTRGMLDDALARRRAHFEGELFDQISMALVRWTVPEPNVETEWSADGSEP
jgi:imidazolonepropionase-like amidohydrolase